MIKQSGKYGLLLAIIKLVVFLIFAFAGLAQSTSASIAIMAIHIILFCFFMILFKKEQGGYLTIGQGVNFGAFVAVIAGLVYTLFTVAYMQFVEPEFMTSTIETQVEQFEESGMTDEQIDQAIETAKFMMRPSILTAIGVISNLIGGVILSLIVSAIIKKEKPATQALDNDE